MFVIDDFDKNPKKPFEVRVPNKIRKRIAMHVRNNPELVVSVPKFIDKVKSLVLPKKAVNPKRGSMWLRFTNRIKKFLK